MLAFCVLAPWACVGPTAFPSRYLCRHSRRFDSRLGEAAQAGPERTHSTMSRAGFRPGWEVFCWYFFLVLTAKSLVDGEQHTLNGPSTPCSRWSIAPSLSGNYTATLTANTTVTILLGMLYVMPFMLRAVASTAPQTLRRASLTFKKKPGDTFRMPCPFIPTCCSGPLRYERFGHYWPWLADAPA